MWVIFKFKIHRSVLANIFVEYNQQNVSFHNFLISVRRFTCFKRVFPSIIRSSKLHIQRQGFFRPLLLPAASQANSRWLYCETLHCLVLLCVYVWVILSIDFPVCILSNLKFPGLISSVIWIKFVNLIKLFLYLSQTIYYSEVFLPDIFVLVHTFHIIIFFCT